MASSTNKPQKRRPKRQPSPRDHSDMTCEALHEEIERLHGMLSTGRENLNYEQNLRIKLSQKLKETKQQLADQKAKTDSFIIKEKETTKELERLRQYSNAEALSASNIATQFGNDIKRMKKKDLQEDYEELQMAHTITQLRFTGELNVEKNKNKTLQEELEKLRASHHQLSVRYENNTLTLRQQVESLQHECEDENKSHASMVEQYIHLIDTLKMEKDTLQCELDNEKLTHADRAEQGQQLIDNLRTENDCLRKEMAEEVLRMQKEADHKASLYQRELEELRDELKLQTSLNLQLSTQLEAEKLSSCEQPEPEPCEDQEPLPSALHDEELTENAVVSEKIMTETTKQKSRWKRFRHFLGLRKPQKWKK